jgi:NhaA family Na+:H+ antiporter
VNTDFSTPKLTVPVSNKDHHFGSLDAPVVIVEYADMECPHCKDVQPILIELMERMGDRICLVFRHFPIQNQHSHAQKAAEAVEAASAQGKFPEMVRTLFRQQDKLELDDLVKHAESVGLDVERFKREVDEGKYADKVREDFRSGIRSGVNGTPTFFINGTRYDGAWDLESLLEVIEKPLGVRVTRLAQEFTRRAASGGILLLIASAIAMFWANSANAESYLHFWESTFSLNFGSFTLSEHLLEWVNSGLMAIFFFVVGLEIKREIQTGELASPRKAALPIMGAIGGMLIPALVYVLFNYNDPQTVQGWGIPMATDIAFTLGILTLLGTRAPLSLKVFFTALAIADDLGGILVIALFYSEGIVWLPLGIAAVILLLLTALNITRVFNKIPYAILGVALWLAFLESGMHPTIAGVLLALTIPTRSPPDTRALLAQAVTVMQEVEHTAEESQSEIPRPGVVQTLEVILERLQSPAQRLERDLTPFSTFIILPIFALANAGVALGQMSATDLFSPVSLGIIFGLVIGKPLGIAFFCWIAIRTGIAELPGDLNFRQLVSASFLAGVGFTLSMFIAGAAFDNEAVLATAKLGVIVASLLAAGLGWVLMTINSPIPTQSTQADLIQVSESPDFG